MTVLPIGVHTRIASIDRYREALPSASSGDAVTIRLVDELDVGRGYMIVDSANPPSSTSRFTADVCWMSDSSSLRPGQQFWIKHTSRRVKCRVASLDDRLDIESLGRIDRPESLSLNDIGLVTIRTHEPLFVDPYKVSRDTGSFILIDAATRSTVAAGMIRDVLDDPTSEDWSI